MMTIMKMIWCLPRNGMIAFLKVYRKLISPLYGDVCRYYPSCSRYAVEAYQNHGFVAGTALTTWRLLRCNPLTSGGVDDVPARKHYRFLITPRGFVRCTERKA